jgi:hypothetical protein
VLVTIVSGKAAPGVTASTWALALGWPRPVLAVDCDPAGGDMAAGLLLGRLQADRGVLSWSAATRRLPALDAATVLAEHAVALPEAAQVWLMPGFQNGVQAGALEAGGWDRLAQALERTAVADRDVLVDVGRLSAGSCWPVIGVADRVVLVCRRSGRSIHAARNAAAMLQTRLGDLAAVDLLVVDASGPYEASSIAQELRVPLLGILPVDYAAAAVLCDGAPGGLRGVTRSKLVRAARRIARVLTSGSASREPNPRVEAAR